MKIIWLSQYRTFSLSSQFGTLILLSIIGIACLMGFMGGVVYQQDYMTKKNVSKKVVNLPTIKQKVRALTNILAELQAKLITLESMQNDLTVTVPSSEKLTRKFNFTEEGIGGLFVPVDKLSALLYPENKTLNGLLTESEYTLKYAKSLESLLLSNEHASDQEQLGSFFIPSMVPVNRGRVASPFGIRRDPFNNAKAMHEGLDFAAARGTHIYAAASGIVKKVRHGGAYGRHTVINHKNGYTTLYAHTSKLFIVEGQMVQKGQLIGAIGATGRVTGPHLHFEVRRYGKAIDPKKILKLSYFKPTK